MKLEERVIDEEHVEYGIGNGLYVSAIRDPLRGGEIILSREHAEIGGERADEILKRTALPADYRDQILKAAQAHFYPEAAEAAE